MKRILGFVCLLLMGMAIPASAQRRPVLPQIDEPHPYYYRELYLPQLTSGPSSLTWGPDSQELIYSMAGSLWRQKLRSKEAAQLTDGPGYDYQPDWSPDGKSVVYVSYQKDAMELWLLDLTTGKTKRLTAGGAVNVEPRWSPDGKKIVWVSTQYNKRFHVFMADVVDGELSNVVRLTGETKSSLPRYYYSAYDMEINPVWTRDGKEILFVSNRGHIYGTGGFWRMKAEPGAEAREIHYEETSWKARPEFSPDGSRMVYSSYLGRQWHNLWVMPANGGDAFPLTYATGMRRMCDGRRMEESSLSLQTKRGPRRFTGKSLRAAMERNWRRKHGIICMPVALSRSMPKVRASHPMFELPSPMKLAARLLPRMRGCKLTTAMTGMSERWKDIISTRERSVDAQVEVPAGRFTVEVSQGLEARAFRKSVEVKAGKVAEVDATLAPLDFNGGREDHWVASDLHVHMNYGGTYRNNRERLMEQGESEGLEVIHELTVNKEQRFPDVQFLHFPPKNGLEEKSLHDPDVLLVQGQEFHTSYWGHRGVLRLKDHLLLPGYAGYPNTAAASLYPMNADVYDMAHAQGALVGAVHPFDEVPDPFAKPAQNITDELPVDVALGKLDYMEIVGFSDHKSTAAVWYKLLNLGFKLPAGGGTDATADYAAPIRGQVGFDRVYVWTPGWPANIETWMDGLKQGRTFATNGPLIEFKLGGEMVGSELKFAAAQAGVPFTAKLRSIVPVDHLEVVCNGKVARELKLEGARDTADFTGTIPLSESGWCVLRAWSDKAEYPVMETIMHDADDKPREM